MLFLDSLVVDAQPGHEQLNFQSVRSTSPGRRFKKEHRAVKLVPGIAKIDNLELESYLELATGTVAAAYGTTVVGVDLDAPSWLLEANEI